MALGLVDHPLSNAGSLRSIYKRLFRRFGPQHWWPAQTPFEMMAGAILAQATNWQNVVRAIDRLRQHGALSPQKILALRSTRLESLVRPAGYFRQKAKRLKEFSRWYVRRYGGRHERMFRIPTDSLRQELLQLHGIGPETADSMLLYAGAKPVFVVDAYTRRLFVRHGLVRPQAAYDEIQRLAMRELPFKASLYNEFHALIVAVGKRACHRRAPACERCPLDDLPHTRVEI